MTRNRGAFCLSARFACGVFHIGNSVFSHSCGVASGAVTPDLMSSGPVLGNLTFSLRFYTLQVQHSSCCIADYELG